MSTAIETKENELLERFIKYVKIDTTSSCENADKGIIPSTPNQQVFANLLCEELQSIGVKDASVQDHCYVCARIPATKGFENKPSIGFLAHMDTASDVSGKDIKPSVIKDYNGDVIKLKANTVLDPKQDIALNNAVGQTIITTDGTTLLGGDDKAGVAAIVTAIDILLNTEKANHGPIEIIFSPDEETGHGMDKVPLEWIQSKTCFTIDAGDIGELESECFNAYKSEIFFSGKAYHTGYCKGKLINAVSMASSFLALLPQNEAPETTENYEGFYAPMEVEGQLETSRVLLYVRDFTTEGMKRRLNTIDSFAKAIEKKFDGSSVKVIHTEQYKNMKENLSKNPIIINTLLKAFELSDVEPIQKPIRGGTDGSRLTEMGINTPNIFTGTHNFHSKNEWVSLTQMYKAVKVIVNIIKLYS